MSLARRLLKSTTLALLVVKSNLVYVLFGGLYEAKEPNVKSNGEITTASDVQASSGL